MRICVFGAGAIGGHLAAKLAAAGHEVSVVARGADPSAIQAKGVALRDGAGADARTIHGRVRASDKASELGAQDVVFVATKATALAGVAPAHGVRFDGVPAPSLEAVHAVTAHLAARKGLYFPP